MRDRLSVGSFAGALVRALAALAVFGLSAGCGAPEPSSAQLSQPIEGGQPTAAGAWPAVGWLDSGCTGVLLAPDLVIFAGHCGARATTIWFGDALEIVVDDAAATARVVAPADAQHVALRDCQVYPDSALGHGTDLGFCWLSEPAVPASVIPPIALGCARAQVSIGTPLTLVGFGVDASGLASLGTKRSVVADVVKLGRELEIGDDEHGACSGDSGGPAFVSVPTDEQRREWALVGILSSGEEGSLCSVGYFTDLSRMVAWLESETARDLTPISRLCRSPDVRAQGGCSLSVAVPDEKDAGAAWLGAALCTVAVARRRRAATLESAKRQSAA